MYSVVELSRIYKVTRKTIYTKLEHEDIQLFVKNTNKGIRLEQEGLNVLNTLLGVSNIYNLNNGKKEGYTVDKQQEVSSIPQNKHIEHEKKPNDTVIETDYTKNIQHTKEGYTTDKQVEDTQNETEYTRDTTIETLENTYISKYIENLENQIIKLDEEKLSLHNEKLEIQKKYDTLVASILEQQKVLMLENKEQKEKRGLFSRFLNN